MNHKSPKLKSEDQESGPVIAISPLCDFDSSLLYSIGEKIKHVYDIPYKIVPLLKEVDFAFDYARKQYYSTKILEKLETVAPDKALKVLALTDVDLFIPILTHVYGEAQLSGRACIVSIHRLRETRFDIKGRHKYTDRMVKESVHELGHTFGLRHCPEENCIMHYSRTIRDVDRKNVEMCRYCNVMLEDELKLLR